jgi:hypothetical protein
LDCPLAHAGVHILRDPFGLDCEYGTFYFSQRIVRLYLNTLLGLFDLGLQARITLSPGMDE